MDAAVQIVRGLRQDAKRGGGGAVTLAASTIEVESTATQSLAAATGRNERDSPAVRRLASAPAP